MDTYEEFREKFKKAFTDSLTEADRARVSFGTARKINREKDTVTLCGDMGHYKGGPCIYPEDFYRRFTAGESMEEVVRKASEVLFTAAGRQYEIPDFSMEYLKEHVVLQLINREWNTEYLKEVPHRDYMDLAVIYRCIMGRDNDTTASCVITNGLMKQVGITEEELYGMAYNSTMKLLSPRVFSMYEMLMQTGRQNHIREEDYPEDMLKALMMSDMRVLSNSGGMLGAYLLLYPDYFSTIPGDGQDMYIIPSSIHELIVLPAAECSKENLLTMIHEVNIGEVAPEERLSDTLYMYDAANKTVRIA